MNATAPQWYPAGQWRAHVLHDPADFTRQQVRVMLGLSGPDGVRLATTTMHPLGDPVDPHVTPEEGEAQPAPFLTLPVEAAEELFRALAAHFLGTSDVTRLSSDLVAERRRVDALIAGIGRMAQPPTRPAGPHWLKDTSGGW